MLKSNLSIEFSRHCTRNHFYPIIRPLSCRLIQISFFRLSATIKWGRTLTFCPLKAESSEGGSVTSACRCPCLYICVCVCVYVTSLCLLGWGGGGEGSLYRYIKIFSLGLSGQMKGDESWLFERRSSLNILTMGVTVGHCMATA